MRGLLSNISNVQRGGKFVTVLRILRRRDVSWITMCLLCLLISTILGLILRIDLLSLIEPVLSPFLYALKVDAIYHVITVVITRSEQAGACTGCSGRELHSRCRSGARRKSLSSFYCNLRKLCWKSSPPGVSTFLWKENNF